MERDEEVGARPAGRLVPVGIVLLAAALSASGLAPQERTGPPPAEAFYAVSYVETTAASTRAAVAALAEYRAASRGLDGFIRLEFFEQVGRPGHFAVVETWRDQRAFDARDPAVQKALLAGLGPIRTSGYDQRPYKVLTTAASSTPVGRPAVFVISHVDVAPNPEVPALLRRLADASRQEAGNLRFDIVQHTMRANHFTVVEAWRDQRALDAHVAAAHTKRHRDDLQPFTGSPLDERIYTIVE